MVEALDEIPRRDKVFPDRLVPVDSVPQPLYGCDDAIGGIESLTIAGRRYWFGYNYSDDAVVSPLIDDARTMAQYASDHMLLSDGAHPAAYWEKEVASAAKSSKRDSDQSEREFTGVELQDAAAEIATARREQRPAMLTLPQHLISLIISTFKCSPPEVPRPCASEAGKAFAKMDRYGDCLGVAMQIAAQKSIAPPGTTYSDALNVTREMLDYFQQVVPENWRSLLVRPSK